MKFHEVSKAMDEGKKIKLKDWDNAYWYKKGGIIVNHDEEGLECDTREIFPFDLMWVADGDWEIVVENLTPMNFKEAFKLMKQGYPVKLPSWGWLLVLGCCKGNYRNAHEGWQRIGYP